MDFSVVNENGTALDASSPAVIKVIGCGGGGSNAVNKMIDANIANVSFIVLNTDLQALNLSRAETRIAIGKKIAQGLGAGGDPKVGEEAAEEDRETLVNLLSETDMVFITAGMGGGTGTGSAPVVARIARELGVLTVGVVTTPFVFEGPIRMRQAQEGIKRLQENVDSLIIVPNEQLSKIVDKKMPLREAFNISNDVLRQGVEGISNIITKAGEVNRDFKDIKKTMHSQGKAVLGIGTADGENRAVDAATKAINNPLLEDTSIEGATNILVNICSNGDITMSEVSEIMSIVTASTDPSVNILWGQVADESFGSTVSVTVIATGFNAKKDLQDDIIVSEVQNSFTNDPSFISKDAFSDILGGKKSDIQNQGQVDLFKENDIRAKVPVTVGSQSSMENNANSSLGIAISNSRVGFTSRGIKSPNRVIDVNDISQPACWRTGELSRGIKLHD